MPEHSHLARLAVGSPEWLARRKLEDALEQHRRTIDEYHHMTASVAVGMTAVLALGIGMLAAFAIRSLRKP